MSIPINFIDPSAKLGHLTKVWHFAVILADVTVGNNSSIGSHVEVGKGSRIGDATRVGSHTFLPANSRIGNHVFIGPNVTFTDDRYPVAGNRDYTPEPPVIDDDVSIGAGSVILPGVFIGRGARIGAGSVVTRNVPPSVLVFGDAARQRTASNDLPSSGKVSSSSTPALV